MTTTASFPSEHLSNGYSPSASAYTNGHGSSMDGRQGDYSHSGLSSPYQHHQLYGGQHSEDSADATSASHYTPGQDVKFNPSGTPTSEYGMNPSPARSTQYQDYMQRPQFPDGAQRYHHNASAQPVGPGQMPQSTSPSTSMPDGAPDGADVREPPSNTDVPVDPSITAHPPPTYPPHVTHGYYAPQHEAPHYPSQPHMYPPQQYGAQYSGAPHMAAGYGHVPTPMAQQSMIPPGTRPPGVSRVNFED